MRDNCGVLPATARMPTRFGRPSLALIYGGGSRTEGAHAGGVGLQVVRDWVLRFNANGPGGLIDRKAPGQPSRLDARHRAALAAMVENGPIPAVHGVVRWRIIDLCQCLWDEYGTNVSKQTLSRELRALDIAKRTSAPPRASRGRHRDVQKNWPATVEAIARERSLDRSDIEVWFGDEARIGQKNKITRRWVGRGTRPSAPSDQRTASTYIFGAICPAEGKAVGLILPWCNTAMMNLHLAAISADIAPGRHAALLLDQAGWHLSRQLSVPDNITIVPLPPKCPELNAQENVWHFMRDNWLSNGVRRHRRAARSLLRGVE